MEIEPERVFCTQLPGATYALLPDVRYPELPRWACATTSLACLRMLLAQAGLDRARIGSSDWNPLGEIVREGDRVVIKPNWVRHRNGSGQGMDCMVTHTSVLEAILFYVARARPGSVVVGDAPVQGCDFVALMADRGVPEMIARFAEHELDVRVMDFRRTILPGEKLGARAQRERRPLNEYLLFDLGRDSALEAITAAESEFRVTMYDPEALRRTHGPGRHQYLVAREVIEADVVINVPKLKTHKKAGITGALKNIVGINGHKEYLPHHRKGGSWDGGDCYPGRSRLKAMVEDLLDATNRAEGAAVRWSLAGAARAAMALGKVAGADNNYDGSWDGNDTVWRMSLDLQRVLHYGRPDGSLDDRAQRRVITVTDAIIAGEGDGPLSPTPMPLGMVTLGSSTAAVDWVHALLMGLAPHRVPLTREAFAPHRYALAGFPPESIVVHVDGRPVAADEVFARHGRAFRLPARWRAHLGEGRRAHVGPPGGGS